MALADNFTQGITNTMTSHEGRFIEAYKTYSADWFKKIKDLKKTIDTQKYAYKKNDKIITMQGKQDWLTDQCSKAEK